MRIHRLKLINFRQHRNTEIEIPERAMLGLLGPNAVGKSTIIEAITWSLYGAKALRGTASSVRWKRAKARQTAEVQLDFEHGGHEFRLLRKEKNAELYEDGLITPRAAGTEAVSQEIAERVLAMSLEEFQTTYFCGQDDLNRIGKMGETERTKFVLRVTQVDQIDCAIDDGRSRKNSMMSERRGLLEGVGERDPFEKEIEDANELVVARQSATRSAQAILESATLQAQAAAAESDASERRKKQHQTEVQHRDAAQQALAVAEREVERLKADLAQARGAADRINAEAARVSRLPELRTERDALLSVQALADRHVSLETDSRTVAAAVSELQKQERTLRDALLTHDPAHLGKIKAETTQATERLQQMRSERASANAVAEAAGKSAAEQIGKAKRKIEAIRAEGPRGECPTCRRELGEQFESTIRALQQDLHDAETQRAQAAARYRVTREPSEEETAAASGLADLQRKLQQASANHDEMGRRTERLESVRHRLSEKISEAARVTEEIKSIRALEWDPNRLTTLEAEIQTLSDAERSLAVNRTVAARLPEITDSLDLAEARRVQAAGQIEDAEKEMLRLDFQIDDHSAVIARYQDATQAKGQAERHLATTTAELKAAEERLQRADRALTVYERKAQRADRLAEHIRLLDATVDALLAFRKEQADAIRPELQERTARYVSILTDGRYPDIVMNDSFGISLIDGDEEMEVISGGSGDIAALALRLALGEMVAERSGTPITLLVLDEPFASLAEQWRENVVNLIRSLSDRFEQVWVISHHDEIRDGVDIPLVVEYDEAEGYSSVAA